jgi:hypothetical protein
MNAQSLFGKLRAIVVVAIVASVFSPLSPLQAQWEIDRAISVDTSAHLNENMGQCLAVSGDTVRVVWVENKSIGNRVSYRHSYDAGVTWGTDTALTTPRKCDMPSIAVSGKYVHIAFRDTLGGVNASFYMRSTDAGITWSTPVSLGAFYWWPSIATSGSYVYMGLNSNATGNSEVHFRRSSDNGLTWDSVIQISNATGRSEDQSISAADGFVYMAWNDNRTGTMQEWYRRSTDNGKTWEAEKQLTNTTTFAYCPLINAHGTFVDFAWAERSTTDSKYGIRIVQSSDHGGTWGTATTLSNFIGCLYPVIARTDSDIHVAWGSTGNSIDYRHSRGAGANWDSTANLVVPSLSPAYQSFIVASGRVLHAIWIDKRSGYPVVYYKRNPTANAATVLPQSVTITSTSAGGNWSNSATWIGGVVPRDTNSVIIDGPVTIPAGGITCVDLQIDFPAVLQNAQGVNASIVVRRVIAMNGYLGPNPSGGTLDVEAWGNIMNNGNWLATNTFLPSSGSRTIAQGAMGTGFQGNLWMKQRNGSVPTTGTLTAITPLVFACPFDLERQSIDMEGNTLTLADSATGPTNGTVRNAASLVQHNGAFSRNVTYQGNVNCSGVTLVDTAVEIAGNLAVTASGVVMNRPSAQSPCLIVTGDITCDGTVVANSLRGNLFVEVGGSLLNPVQWWPDRTYIPLAHPQQLGASPGQFLGGEFIASDHRGIAYDTSVSLTAVGWLGFTGSFDLKHHTLDMDSARLVLYGGSGPKYGTVRNVDNIAWGNGAISKQVTYQGTMITLLGDAQMDNGVVFDGDVTVADTIENSNEHQLSVRAVFTRALTNNGILRSNPAGGVFDVECSGFVANLGSWNNRYVIVTGYGDRGFSLRNASTVVRMQGSIRFRGLNVIPALQLDSNSYTLIPSDATVVVNENPFTGTGSLVNRGALVCTLYKDRGVSEVDFFGGRIIFSDTINPATIVAEHLGYQDPGFLAHAVQRFYHIYISVGNSDVVARSLTLKYDSEELNGNDSSSMKMLYWLGGPWTEISDPLIVRDTKDLSVTVHSIALSTTTKEFAFTSFPTLVNDNLPETPRTTALRGYPNPASSMMQVAFTMPQREYFRVTVEDALGRTVGVLQDGVIDQGEHVINWNTSNVPAGMYSIVSASVSGRMVERVSVVR